MICDTMSHLRSSQEQVSTITPVLEIGSNDKKGGLVASRSEQVLDLLCKRRDGAVVESQVDLVGSLARRDDDRCW